MSQNAAAPHLGLLGAPKSSDLGFQQSRWGEALSGLTGAEWPLGVTLVADKPIQKELGYAGLARPHFPVFRLEEAGWPL